jgi:type I restriction enzyme S subunit
MNKPKVRFQGYTDDWEQRKLGDVLVRRIEQRQQSKEYPRLAFASGQGVIPLSERKTNNREQLTKDEFTKKYLVTELDDIVYNPANVKYGAIDRNKCGRGLISPIYVTFTTSEIPGFVERIVTSHDFQQRALKFEEGTVTKRQSVNPEDFVTIDVLVASAREEQKKISEYFDSIDHLITLHQRKCDETKMLKKYMLQKMFPKDGKCVPEIRFSGYTDDWEQCKLGEVLTLLKDGTHGTHKDSDYGPYLLSAKNIKNGQIIIDESSDRKISEAAHEQIHSSFKLQRGDVLLTIVGSIGESAILENTEGLTFQRSVAFLRPNNEMTSRFLRTEIEADKFQKELQDRKSQSAQPGVYLGELEKIPVVFPKIDEQKKIGAYFSSLDHLITLHQRKCDELKKMKKFMLQNMFV